MSISDQIRVLCARLNISVSALARRIGTTPQNLNAKMKRESFSIHDLNVIATALNCTFERFFVLPTGEKI